MDSNDSTSAGSGSSKSALPVSQPPADKGNSSVTQENSGGPKNIKKIIRIVVIVLVAGGIVAFFLMRNKPEGKPGWLRLSGRLEGYETNVGAKIAGRVQSISNREGEEVKRGQLLVQLSDEDIQAQLRGAHAKYDQAEESIKEAEAQLAASREQVKQAQLNVSQAKEDALGRIQQAQANVAAQQAEYAQALAQEAQAKAEYELAKIRIKRYDELVVQGAVTQDEADQAHSTYKSAAATVNARKAAVASAAKQIAAAQAALTQAKSNALNPPIRMSQQESNLKTVAQNEAAVARAKLELRNAKASIDEIQSNIDYLTIKSPINGIVTARTVEPGAVVAAGQTVISLIDLDTVFMRAYVPDSEAGKVRINQAALIYYDSDPKKGIHGRVIEIDPKASFTPENIYFKEDRVKQVFGIKILIDNPDHYAKPGMPADADIDINPSSGAKNS
ncbi:MAG TPA: efflux RND transporter periplasmic adaptor subunit [Drouetiella sp.]|jgi:HlyD family secretion protein